MTNSLGLIEVRNFIGAVAAADAILKNTDAKISKENAGSGSILLRITGERDSVKAAVELGADAARQLGLYLGSNIIDDPLPQLEDLFFKTERMKNTKNEITEPEHIKENEVKPKKQTRKIKVEKKAVIPNILKSEAKKNEDKTVEINAKANIKKVELPKEKIVEEKKGSIKKAKVESAPSLFEFENDTIARLRKEALESEEVETSNQAVEIEDKIEKKQEEQELTGQKNDIGNMNVHELRHLARSLDNFPIKGRVISKANRQVLLNHFKNIKYNTESEVN